MDDDQAIKEALALTHKAVEHGGAKTGEIAGLVESLFFTLRGLTPERLAEHDKTEAKSVLMRPAVPFEQWAGKEQSFVVCLECGAKAQDLALHLKKAHAMEWGAYVNKWAWYANKHGFEFRKLSGKLADKRRGNAASSFNNVAVPVVAPVVAPVVEEDDPDERPPTAEELENDRINRTCVAACNYVKKVRGNADVLLSEVAAKLNQPASWIRYTIDDSPRCGYRVTDEYDENGRISQTWVGLS